MVKLKRTLKLTKESKIKNKKNEDQTWKNYKQKLWIQGWNCKICFDKTVDNQNLKSKYWGSNFKYHQNQNLEVQL